MSSGVQMLETAWWNICYYFVYNFHLLFDLCYIFWTTKHKKFEAVSKREDGFFGRSHQALAS